MIRPVSAQLLNGITAVDLNETVSMPGGEEFASPVSGDLTTINAPFYASIERAQRAGKNTLTAIIAETYKARAEAGRAQRERAAHTP